MNAPPLARRDRLALCDLFDELGPEARTLNEGWTTADLAAHLVARDRRPDSVPGLVVPALASWSEHVRHGILRRPYSDVVENLRTGPPKWSPLRRPGPDRMATPTSSSCTTKMSVGAATNGSLDSSMRRRTPTFGTSCVGSGGAVRRSSVGVVLRWGDQTFQAHRGPTAVTITGPPGEILLYAFGRQRHARVGLEGEGGAVEALATTTLSW